MPQQDGLVRRPTKIAQIPASAPREKESIPVRVVKNFLPSSINLVKGLFVDLPVAIVTGAGKLATDPVGSAKAVGNLARNPGRILSPLVEKYRNGIFEALADDPAGVLADAVGIATLGGFSAVKLGAQIGSAAGKTLARSGAALTKYATAIDPVANAFKLAGKAARPVLTKLGVGRWTSQLSAARANELGAEAKNWQAALKDADAFGVRPEELPALQKAIETGRTADYAPLTAEGRRAYDSIKKWVREEREPHLSGTSQMSPEELRASDLSRAAVTDLAREGKTAALVGAGWDDLVRSRVPGIEQEIAAGARDPFYHRLFTPDSFDRPTFLESLAPGFRNKAAKPGFVRRMFGRADEYSRDPITVYLRSRYEYHQHKANLRFLDRTEEMLDKAGEIRALPEGAQPRPGYVALPYGALKLAQVAKIRAQAVAHQGIRRGLTPDQVRVAAEKGLLADPAFMNQVRNAAIVEVPEEVANYLKRIVGDVPVLIRSFDQARDIWKAAVTLWNPSYWINIPVANAIMGVFYGIRPRDLRMVRNVLDSLPPETVGGFMQEFAWRRPESWFGRLNESLKRRVAKLDDALRQTATVKAVRDEVRANLVKALGTNTIAEKDLIVAVQQHLRGKARLSAAESKVRRAAEQMAKTDIEIARLVTAEASVGGAVARLARSPRGRGAVSATPELLGAPGTALPSRPTAAAESFPSTPGVGPKLSGQQQPFPAGLPSQEPARDIYATGAGRTVVVKGTGSIVPEQVGGLPAVPETPDIYATGGRIRRPRPIQEADPVTGEFPQPPVSDRPGPVLPRDVTPPAPVETPGPVLPRDYPEARAAWEAHDPIYGALEGANPSPEDLLRYRQISKLADRATKLSDDVAELTARRLRLMAREGRLQQIVPELRQMEAITERGVSAANSITGSFFRLHPIESQYLRRLIPFYTYTKMISNLAFRLPYLFPKQTFMWHQFAKMAHEAVHDERTPEWVRDYAPVGVLKDGSWLAVRVASLNPFNSVRLGSVAGLGIPNILDIVAQHPLINLTYEQVGGTPRWNKKPVSPGEGAVRMDSGEVYEVTAQGGLRRVLATPSFLKSLFYMFPQTQLIEQLVEPYVQTDRGWLFRPQAITGPDGEPMFPYELWQTLPRLLGVPRLQSINPEEEKNKEFVRSQLVRRQWAQKMPRMHPDDRRAAMEILNTWDFTRFER